MKFRVIVSFSNSYSDSDGGRTFDCLVDAVDFASYWLDSASFAQPYAEIKVI